jgi:hypothetical protein
MALALLLGTLLTAACSSPPAPPVKDVEVSAPAAEPDHTQAAESLSEVANAKPQATAGAPPLEPVVVEQVDLRVSTDTKPPAKANADRSTFAQPFPGVRVRVSPPTVEIDSERCLDVGYLEQVACMPGTREHEALVVVRARPSHVHAAMLMAGFEPGKPGEWIAHDAEKRIEVRPPTGPKLLLTMRYEKDGKRIEEPATTWIRDHLGEQTFPHEPWVFAGSLFEKNPEFMGPGEHYVADQTGSIIGLVTFGDETIAYSNVIADQVDVQPAEWEVDDRTAPPVGTKVTIVITPWEANR